MFGKVAKIPFLALALYLEFLPSPYLPSCVSEAELEKKNTNLEIKRVPILYMQVLVNRYIVNNVQLKFTKNIMTFPKYLYLLILSFSFHTERSRFFFFNSWYSKTTDKIFKHTNFKFYSISTTIDSIDYI